MEPNDNFSDSPSSIIPVADAVVITANWRIYTATSGQNFNIKGFYIPVTTVNELLSNNPDIDGIRAYLGLKTVDDPTSATLLLVPVKNNADIIRRPMEQSGAEDSNIYDRIPPCPPICSDDNELNS